VALLNRELILDRLEDAAAGKRLRGVVDAGHFVPDDAEIARALLMRATEDRVHSVRTAAIDALGPSLGTPAVGGELMKLLESAESPLVQLALVDLVLRNGSNEQLAQLLRLANEGALHPDLVRHVERSLGSETV
jgi:HEAT repeat protein